MLLSIPLQAKGSQPFLTGNPCRFFLFAAEKRKVDFPNINPLLSQTPSLLPGHDTVVYTPIDRQSGDSPIGFLYRSDIPGSVDIAVS